MDKERGALLITRETTECSASREYVKEDREKSQSIPVLVLKDTKD